MESTFSQNKELQDALKNLEEEHTKHTQYSAVCNFIQKVFKNDNIDEALRKKVQNLFTSHEEAQCIQLKSNGSNLLGLSDPINRIDISYEDQQKISDLLESKLSKNETKKENILLPRLEIEKENKILMEYRMKLIESMKTYSDGLDQKNEYLSEITNSRRDNLVQLCKDKLDELTAKMKSNECKAKIVRENFRKSVFTETTVALDAYKMLMQDIESQRNECTEDIEALNELKQKYELARSMEFDQVLKSYLEYKSYVETKKELLSKLGKM